MTEDLRKLAKDHSGRADDAGRLARLLAQQLDTIERLTAENEEHLKDKVALAMEVEQQRELLEKARNALERVTESETFYKDPKGDTAGPVIDAITQHLQPKEGEKK